MNFAQKYFKRFNVLEAQINGLASSETEIIVVIPCSNEPDLIKTLSSLNKCEFSGFSAEVICVINSSENADESLKEFNRNTYNQAKDAILGFGNPNIKFHLLLHENLQAKFAGVGLARKIGMDEAIHRFEAINKPRGIITGFDADSTVDPNYFKEINISFSENSKLNGASLYFEHPISGNEFPENIYQGITAYELHLRYFNQSLRRAGFPHAFHTVGSSFAVRADIYTNQGGMNRKKAGEDFYFLQKVIPLGNFAEINSVRIIPSPRTSDRVPFGTGAALAKMEDADDYNFQTYNFEAFNDLQILFSKVDKYYELDITSELPKPLKEFLEQNKIKDKLSEMRKNSVGVESFVKRFYTFFDAFRIIRFLNISHQDYYEKTKNVNAATAFLKKYYSDAKITQIVQSNTISEVDKQKHALLFFRDIERNIIGPEV